MSIDKSAELLNNRDTMATTKNVSSLLLNSDVFYSVLGTILLVVILLQTFTLTESTLRQTPLPMDMNILNTVFLLFGFLCLYVLYLLVINRRSVISVLSVVLVLTITIGGYVTMMQYPGFSENPNAARNIIFSIAFIYLVPYTIAHVIVHGLAWLNDRKRNVFTKWGIFNYLGVIFGIILLSEILKEVFRILA